MTKKKHVTYCNQPFLYLINIFLCLQSMSALLPNLCQVGFKLEFADSNQFFVSSTANVRPQLHIKGNLNHPSDPPPSGWPSCPADWPSDPPAGPKTPAARPQTSYKKPSKLYTRPSDHSSCPSGSEGKPTKSEGLRVRQQGLRASQRRSGRTKEKKRCAHLLQSA